MALAVSLLSLLFAVAPALAQEMENQFWPEINAFLRLSGKTRLYFIYSATRQENLGEYSDGQVGAFAVLFPVNVWK